MNRRTFLRQAGAAAAAWVVSTRTGRTAATARMNVLFITVDDLRPELGCYGRARAHTPNLDRLAASGVRFERAYCQQAICAPSRASVLGGVRPDTLGFYDLDTPLRKAHPALVTLPQAFKAAGYETLTLGKIYHHREDDAAGWTRRPETRQAMYAGEDALAFVRARTAEARARGLTGRDAMNHARGPATECAAVDDAAYSDGAMAAEAIRQMEALKDQPFFLAAGFLKPHLPFCAPKKYWDLFDPAKIELPDETRPEGMPGQALTNFGELRNYADMPKGNAPLSRAQKIRLIHGYLAATAYLDAQVGRLLDALERLKLADRTVVLVWGDHGWKLGEYASWCKHSNMEIDTRIPLIVRAPGFARGGAAAGLVEAVDFFPTLAELCGVPAPASCEGKSFVPQLRDPKAPGKPCAISQYPRGRTMGYSLRTDRWRYTEWYDTQKGRVVARELYDRSGGDFVNERENLADRPEQAEVVRSLARQLRPFMRPWKNPVPAAD